LTVTIDLTGKLALVTGSSRGLGRRYALDLAAAGADVLIHDVHERAAAEFGEAPSGLAVAEEIRALGRRSSFLAADLTDPRQVAALVERAIEEFGHIDILVNNAGGDIGARTPRPEPNDALDIHDDDIRAVVDRNLLTAMYTCKSSWPWRTITRTTTGRTPSSPSTWRCSVASSRPYSVIRPFRVQTGELRPTRERVPARLHV